MTIYECLGIENLLIDVSIPIETILENIKEYRFGINADVFLEDVDSVVLKSSINRNEHYLQIIEIKLNSTNHINEISFILQKAIKYRILFVFVYDDRYLILYRNFNLTQSTENVYSQHVKFCTDWIYDEYLCEDIVCGYDANPIKQDYDDEYSVQDIVKRTGYDNNDFLFFKDIINNARELNACISQCYFMSARWFYDWYNSHAIKRYLSIKEFLSNEYVKNSYIVLDEHIFIEKTAIANVIISSLDWKIYPKFYNTGRHPFNFFNNINNAATYENEQEIKHLILSDDFIVDDDRKYYLSEDEKYELGKITKANEFRYCSSSGKIKEAFEILSKETTHSIEECRSDEEKIFVGEKQKSKETEKNFGEYSRKNAIYIKAVLSYSSDDIAILTQALFELESIADLRDSKEQILKFRNRISELVIKRQEKEVEQIRLEEEQRKAEALRLEEKIKKEKAIRVKERKRQHILQVTDILKQVYSIKFEKQEKLLNIQKLLCLLDKIYKKKYEEEKQRQLELRRLEEEQKQAEQIRLEEEQRKAEVLRLEEKIKKEKAIQVKERKRQHILQVTDILKQVYSIKFEKQEKLLNIQKLLCLLDKIYKKKYEEEKQRQLELRRLEEEQKQAEQIRLEEEQKNKNKTYNQTIQMYSSNNISKLTSAILILEELSGWKDSSLQISRFKNKISLLLEEEEEKRKAEYRSKKLCQYCGGRFKGLFVKVCKKCGIKKDY